MRFGTSRIAVVVYRHAKTIVFDEVGTEETRWRAHSSIKNKGLRPIAADKGNLRLSLKIKRGAKRVETPKVAYIMGLAKRRVGEKEAAIQQCARDRDRWQGSTEFVDGDRPAVKF